MSETIAFSVAYGTTFEQIEALRKKMLSFVESERRDYLPTFDVAIVGQTKPVRLKFLRC